METLLPPSSRLGLTMTTQSKYGLPASSKATPLISRSRIQAVKTRILRRQLCDSEIGAVALPTSSPAVRTENRTEQKDEREQNRTPAPGAEETSPPAAEEPHPDEIERAPPFQPAPAPCFTAQKMTAVTRRQARAPFPNDILWCLV